MNNDNVVAVRNAYAVAERKDLEGWINLFTPDGVFTDNSVGVTYRGRSLADPVRNYGTAFSNMHRELYRIYSDGNVVVVRLALQGIHDGPLQLPFGELANPTSAVGRIKSLESMGIPESFHYICADSSAVGKRIPRRCNRIRWCSVG